MQTFEIEANGRSFEVEAPDSATALKAVQLNGGGTTQTADVLKSAAAGVGKGVAGLVGLPGDLGRLAGLARDKYVSNPILRAIGQPEIDTKIYDAPSKIGSGAVQKGIESVTGEFYKPQTTAGKYAETVGEFAPAVISGPGGAVRKVAQAMLGGIASEGAGQLTEGTAAEPFARVGGAIVGGGLPGGLQKIATPIGISSERQRLVDILNKEGVTSLTAGQKTGSKTLQYAESILGDAPGAGGSASRVQQEGQRQFTEAAMRRAGAGPNAAPEVLAENSQRLGDQFRDLSARNNLIPDNQFITDLTRAVRNYRNVPESQQRAMIQGYIDDIVPHVNAGQMPGPMYQEMRSRLSSQANSLRNSDPSLSEALRDTRNALDKAMERSIPATSGDAELWREARRQYSAQKTIEKAASRAGEATAEGQIVPANLRNAASAENRGAYARGQGQFSELSRAGSGVMAPLPNSGTAQRQLITAISAAIGGGGGGFLTGGVGGAAGAVAGAAAPGAFGRVLMSRPMQWYLSNSKFPQAASPGVERVARQLLLMEPALAPQLQSR